MIRVGEYAYFLYNYETFIIFVITEEYSKVKKKCLELKDENSSLEEKYGKLQAQEALFEKIKLGYNKLSRENKRLEEKVRESEEQVSAQESIERDWQRTLETIRDRQSVLERENKGTELFHSLPPPIRFA